MKKLLVSATLILMSTFAAVAQSSKDEQEVRRFLADYDNAEPQTTTGRKCVDPCLTL